MLAPQWRIICQEAESVNLLFWNCLIAFALWKKGYNVSWDIAVNCVTLCERDSCFEGR